MNAILMSTGMPPAQLCWRGRAARLAETPGSRGMMPEVVFVYEKR